MLPPLFAIAPTCAKCGFRVRQLVAHEDVQRQVLVFTAHCHGEQETTELTYQDLRGGAKISAGRAFESKGVLS